MGNHDKSMFTSIDPKEISIPQLHQYLLSGIAPRPIALASTMDKAGNVNLSPFSYFNVFGANPPLLVFSPARRVRDNTIKHTLENVIEHPEVVINIVDFDMVEQMSLSSTEYGEKVNEFIKSGLTQVPGKRVKVPRVKESPVSFECKVERIIETGKEGGAGNLVFCKVVMIHVEKELLDLEGMIDPLKLDLVGRMGGSWYTRSNSNNMFEIPKPLKTKGIGVDSLPESVRNSEVLTGNNLGRLGNAEFKPSQKQIDGVKTLLEEKGFTKTHSINQIHAFAKERLEKGFLDQALSILWYADQNYGV